MATDRRGNFLIATPDVRGTIAAAQQTYERTYDPLQVTVVNAAPNLTPDNVLQAWQLTSETTLDSLTLMQAHLLESSRVRLEGLVAQAQRSAFLVTLLAVGGVVAAVLILLVVRRRVIQPLRQVSEAMVRLAANDLTTPAPRARRHDEVGQMTNALQQSRDERSCSGWVHRPRSLPVYQSGLRELWLGAMTSIMRNRCGCRAALDCSSARSMSPEGEL